MTTVQDAPDVSTPATTDVQQARMESISTFTEVAFQAGRSEGYTAGHSDGWHSGYEAAMAGAAELERA